MSEPRMNCVEGFTVYSKFFVTSLKNQQLTALTQLNAQLNAQCALKPLHGKYIRMHAKMQKKFILFVFFLKLRFRTDAYAHATTCERLTMSTFTVRVCCLFHSAPTCLCVGVGYFNHRSPVMSDNKISLLFLLFNSTVPKLLFTIA